MRLSKLTFLAFQINYLLDRGYYDFSIDNIKAKIRDGSLFNYLKQKTKDDYLDLSILDIKDKKHLLERFEGFADNIDEGRKMAVRKNGLCLLLAYIIEIIQEDMIH